MKLNKVETVNNATTEKSIFTLSTTSSEGAKPIGTKGGRLCQAIDYCFNEKANYFGQDCTIDFELDSDKFQIKKYRSEDDQYKTVLKRSVEGRMQVVARNNNVRGYLEAILGEEMDDVLAQSCVDAGDVRKFNGSLLEFNQLNGLVEVSRTLEKTYEDTLQKSEDAMATVRSLTVATKGVTTQEEVEKVAKSITAKRKECYDLQNKLSELKQSRASGVLAGEIVGELSKAQAQYEKLVSESAVIEQKRRQLEVRDNITSVVPKIRDLETLAIQKAKVEKQKFEIAKELEWQEKEFNGISQQLEQKLLQSNSTIEKKSKADIVSKELRNIAELHDRNKVLNEYLIKLNDQQESLASDKMALKNKLSAIELSIKEIKQGIDSFSVPNKSLGELVETVKVDVKLDEIDNQIDKLNGEVAIKESQIAEKESALVNKVRRFKSVAELDVSVAPIRAKDTILQVLDTKLNKLEVVNTTLKEKLNNYQRALEEAKYELVQVDQSRECLNLSLNKEIGRQQEEFKREVLLNSQKVYDDDATAVFAVSSNINGEAIESIKIELGERNIERDKLYKRASALEGGLKEIQRHIEINEADIESLRKEKSNINKRYNEIVSQNKNETVFNYLRAMENDSGTKYLLTIQEDAVKNETELTELKKSVEQTKSKIVSLQSRKKYLNDSHLLLDSEQNSIESFVRTNDQIKGELADIGDRLSANYEKHKSILTQIEEVDNKIYRVQQVLIETGKTVKVNERQILEANRRASEIAGTNDIENVVTNYNYEVEDIEAERKMLFDNKTSLEKDVFKKRLELSKLTWLYENKLTEYNAFKEALQGEFNSKGIRPEQVEEIAAIGDGNDIRREIDNYDKTKAQLLEKIENYYSILRSQPNSTMSMDKSLPRQIAEIQSDIAQANNQLEELEKVRQEKFNSYLMASNSKLRLAVAATEVDTLNNLKQSLAQTKVVQSLLTEKVVSVVKSIARIYNAFVEGEPEEIKINNDYELLLGKENKTYSQLEDREKTLLYIAVVLSIPYMDKTSGRCLVLGDRLGIDKTDIERIVAVAQDLIMETDYARIAPKEIKKDVS